MAKVKMVLASSNPGKLREFQALLAPFDIELIPQSQFGIADVKETGLTFIENALIKARFAANVSGLPALADDSGLTIDALQNAPGIYSARYAGIKASDKENIDKVLKELKAVPADKRDAYFHCFLVFLLNPEDPLPLIAYGKWKGRILSQPEGKEGFGYDPIFYVAEEQKTAAELSLGLKNKISHRGQALQTFLNLLPEKLCTLSMSNN